MGLKRFGLLAALLTMFVASAAPSDLRVMVLIPEQVIRRVVPDPAAETEIARVLIQQGFRVVDVSQADKLKARDETVALLKGGSKDSLINLGLKFNADVLITGEAFAEETSPQPEEVRNAGLRAYLARLEVKGIDLSSGQMFISEAFTGAGIAAADLIAGKTALQRTAEKAAPIIAQRLSNWETGRTVAGRVFIVKIVGLQSFKALNDLIERVRKLLNVNAVKNRQFDLQGAELEVVYAGPIEALAAALEDLGLKITNVNAGEIRVSIR